MWQQNRTAATSAKFCKRPSETEKGRLSVDRARALVRRSDTTWDIVVHELRARCADLIRVAANAGITRIRYAVPLYSPGMPIYHTNMERVANGLADKLRSDGYRVTVKERPWAVIVEFSPSSSKSKKKKKQGGDAFSKLIVRTD
jgi:hypothetical protein